MPSITWSYRLVEIHMRAVGMSLWVSRCFHGACVGRWPQLRRDNPVVGPTVEDRWPMCTAVIPTTGRRRAQVCGFIRNRMESWWAHHSCRNGLIIRKVIFLAFLTCAIRIPITLSLKKKEEAKKSEMGSLEDTRARRGIMIQLLFFLRWVPWIKKIRPYFILYNLYLVSRVLAVNTHRRNKDLESCSAIYGYFATNNL